MSDPAVWSALCALIAGCFIASCSVALKIYSRSKLSDLLLARGREDRLSDFVDRVPRLQTVAGTISASLNLLVLLAVLFCLRRRTDWEDWEVYVVSFCVAGGLVSVFMVAIPLSLARYHSELLLARFMVPLQVMDVIFRPMAVVLHAFDPVVRRISGGRSSEDADPVSDRIMTVVEDHEAQGAVDQGQKQMIEAVFELTETTAGEIMTPRTQMKGIEVEATLDDVKETILREGHSRVPVYEGDMDHIVGMLYAKDLLRFVGSGNGLFELRSILREALIVPESKWVRELLGEFKQRKVHIAIVLDEYGGTAGLVSIEDILEELVGEIQDEYEPTEQDPEIRRIDEKTFDVDARVHVDELNDQVNVRLPEDEDYETVGGFVFSTLGHIPDRGEDFRYQNIRIIVTDVERTKINRVRIEMLETSEKVTCDKGG